MKIAESVSECKESTKENQGEVFSETMGFCPKTIDHSQGLSEDYQKTIKDYEKIMTDY